MRPVRGARGWLPRVLLAATLVAIAVPSGSKRGVPVALVPRSGIERMQLGIGCRAVVGFPGMPVRLQDTKALGMRLDEVRWMKPLLDPYMRLVLDTLERAAADRDVLESLRALCRREKLPAQIDTTRRPGDSIVSRGTTDGLGWSLAVRRDINGVCIFLRDGEGGTSASCAPEELLAMQSVAADRWRVSKRLDALRFRDIDFIVGSAEPSVVRIVVHLTGRPDIVVETVRPAGFDRAFFIMRIPLEAGELTVIGLDAAGGEVGRFVVREEPATGPAHDQ